MRLSLVPKLIFMPPYLEMPDIKPRPGNRYERDLRDLSEGESGRSIRKPAIVWAYALSPPLCSILTGEADGMHSVLPLSLGELS